MIERLHRLLLGLLPREFRERFGPEMIATARAIDAERPRRIGRLLRAVSDAIATGWTVRREVRAEATRRLPGRGGGRLEPIGADVRFVWRSLRREPGFTAFCITALALGLGANLAMFGIADRLFLRGPDHVRDAPRVIRLYATTQPRGMRAFTTSGFGYVTYDLLRQGTPSFADIATYAINDGVLGAGAEARPIRIGYATAGLFPLLGVQAARGRFFTEVDDRPDGPAAVAVVSEAAARTWFGGTADAVGRSIAIGDAPFTVIGVTPGGFTGPQYGRVDVWVPGSLLGARITAGWQTSWNAQWLQIVARLRPGATFEAAGRDATAAHRAGYSGGDPAEAEARFTVAPLRAGDSGTETADVRVLQWLSGVAALVLVVACANVVNLLLARGMRRRREIAIRAALGGGRARLMRLLLLEALVLSGAGAALGLVVAALAGSTARRALFTTVEWTNSPVNARVLVVSALLAVVTAVLVGVIPALRASRADLGDALKTGVRDGGGRRSRLRTALTVAQAALSVVLLVGAGLFARSMHRAYTLDMGFDPDRVTVVEVSRSSLTRIPAGPARDAERARRRAFYFEVLDRVRALPGVEQASVAIGTPFGNRFSVKLRVPNRPELPRLPGGGPGLSAVTSSYFETMGTSIREGRGFTSQEGAGTEPIAIVSQLMADTIWPQGDAIGQCLLIGEGTPPCARIVGVAENTYRSRLREDPVMHYYIPAGQEVGFGGAALLVRHAPGREAPIADIRQSLSALDPTVSLVTTETVRARIEPQMRSWKLGATVFAIAGLLALAVACIGMYSVMSYIIADRRHEFGVRIALGARSADIVGLVLRGGVAMALTGLVIGEAIAAGLGRIAAPLLFGTSPRDPGVFAAVGVVLIAAALVATVGPAARARQVDPIEALRAE